MHMYIKYKTQALGCVFSSNITVAQR